MSKRWIQVVAICWMTAMGTTAQAYYNPQAGRFIQRDPLGYADGMNLYEYVRGNPMGGYDPSGKCRVSASGIRYRVPIANLDAHQADNGYSKMAWHLRNRLNTQSPVYMTYHLFAPQLNTTGPFTVSSPAQGNLPAGAVVAGHFFFFIDWEIDETEGPCELFGFETITFKQDGQPQQGPIPVNKGPAQLFWTKSKRKQAIDGCYKTLIFADAPGLGPAFIQGKWPGGGKGFKMSIQQRMEVRRANNNGPVSTVSHTVEIGVDSNGVIMTSP